MCAREAFGSVKTSNFYVQEFSTDIEFNELTRQGGKLGVFRLSYLTQNF